jgi:hypothetical protein
LHPPFQKAFASILQGKPALAEPEKSRVNERIDSDPFSIARGMRHQVGMALVLGSITPGQSILLSGVLQCMLGTLTQITSAGAA